MNYIMLKAFNICYHTKYSSAYQQSTSVGLWSSFLAVIRTVSRTNEKRPVTIASNNAIIRETVQHSGNNRFKQFSHIRNSSILRYSYYLGIVSNYHDLHSIFSLLHLSRSPTCQLITDKRNG